MNGSIYPGLAFGLFCLLVGFILLWIGGRTATRRPHLINTFSCLLIALGVVVPVFSIFPESSASGTVMGVKIGGAFAALILLFMLVMKMSGESEKRDELEAEIRRLKELLRRPEPIGNCDTHAYTLKDAPGKKLSLITGDIQNIKCVDLWVSSENTNMEMARFYDRSVSAAIRYYGATRDEAGNVTADLIADELKKVTAGNLNVAPTSLFVTGPGELISNGVKQIFHVAAVYGQKPMGYRAVDDLGGCVRKALVEAEKYKGNGYKSILFPLMATGTARGELKPISKRLIETALSYLEKNPTSTIETVYFLTWSDIDLETCTAILGELSERVQPDKA